MHTFRLISSGATPRAACVVAAFALGIVGVLGSARAAAAGPTRESVPWESGAVEIVRDAFGVPHVFAADAPGAYFGQGYVCVQDRMWQLERYRRSARGRMAEVFGSDHLESDFAQRRDFYTDEEWAADFAKLSPRAQEIWKAYVAGVNAGVRARVQAGKIPPEYAKHGLQPEEFTLVDSQAIGAEMARRFGEGGDHELQVEQMLDFLRLKVGAEKAEAVLDDILPVDDPRAPTTMRDEVRRPRLGPLDGNPATGAAAGEGASKPATPPAPAEKPRKPGRPDRERPRDRRGGKPASDGEFFAAAKAAANPDGGEIVAGASPEWVTLAGEAGAERARLTTYRRANGLVWRLGSNAWVVGPKKADRGFPMLFGGPMMGFKTPQIAYEVHLTAPGLNTAGMGFAGVPGVLIGVNENGAWTTTSGIGDNTDFFRLRLNPENPDQYWHNGEWRAIEKREVAIAVKGAPPVTRVVERAHYGPIVRRGKGWAIACARAHWRIEFGVFESILGFNFAKNIQEFATGAATVNTSHNFFWADRAGDIGWWFCGRFPVRHPEADIRRVQPGDGSRDWKGMVKFEDQPHQVNPASGFLGNWNNKPAREWKIIGMGEMFQVHRIYQVLEAKEKLTYKEFADIAYDAGTNNYAADHLKPFLLRAVERAGGPRDAQESAALSALRRWDNVERHGSVGQNVFAAWFSQARRRMLGKYVPPMFMDQLPPSVVLHAFDGENAGVRVKTDFFEGRTRDEVIIEAFRAAVAALVRDRGADPAAWGYDAPRINFDPLPSIRDANRGTYMLLAECSPSGVIAESALPPGQSEDPASLHFGDQLRMFENWEYKPITLDRAALLARLGMK
ncbi:MAG: penicillin acylase family protein [Planctomycetes bacterium]|nr:penicillin acylase family protein [Planctomycetota bacterium]